MKSGGSVGDVVAQWEIFQNWGVGESRSHKYAQLVQRDELVFDSLMAVRRFGQSVPVPIH